MNEREKASNLNVTLRLLLAGIFLIAGGAKLATIDAMVSAFGTWGYGTDFMILIGALEVAGAVMLFLAKSRFVGAVLLGWIMVGAVATHWSSGQLLLSTVPLALLALLGIVIALNLPKGQDHAPWEEVPLHRDHIPSDSVESGGEPALMPAPSPRQQTSRQAAATGAQQQS